jgi:LmbE family N-acetylglucosaminyl deacetylase
VAFHAHPDDEALFTGGTLARCSAEGHRVVLVVATGGERGLSGSGAVGAELGAIRAAELERAARALGVARVVTLGYADSGMDRPEVPPPGSFCAAPVDEAAARLAEVLAEERADVLTVYDEAGGYGHRDHVRVREVGVAAAALAGTPRVLEATIEREAIQRVIRLVNRLGVRPGGMRAADLAGAYRPRAHITHAVDVRRYVRAKQRALAAHASQASGGQDVRTVWLLARLPWPLSWAVLGREWFVEIGLAGAPKPRKDIFGAGPTG